LTVCFIHISVYVLLPHYSCFRGDAAKILFVRLVDDVLGRHPG